MRRGCWQPLASHEIAERRPQRTGWRIERHRAEARLPPGKTGSGFNFDAVPHVENTVPRTVF